MSILWMKIEFYKGKSGDPNRNWGLSQNLGMVLGGLSPNLFNVFKSIKPLTMALQKLNSWPEKLYQFITTLFFLVNTPTPGTIIIPQREESHTKLPS